MPTRTTKPRLPKHDYWAAENRGMCPLRCVGQRVVLEVKDSLGRPTGEKREAVVVFAMEHPQLKLMQLIGYRYE